MGAAATSEDASKSLRVDKSQIAKTIVFVADTGDVVLVVLRADRRVDQSGLAKLLGYKRLRLARDSEVVENTGYRPGGVPPLGHAKPLPVFIDREVSEGAYYCGGGDDKHLLFLDFREIPSRLNVKVIDVPKK
ncbi:MAG: YbaK/EbsC family protein [Infirmifilum sp.]